MEQKKYGDASVEFRNAIRIDPRFIEAYYQLAQAELAQHDWPGAFGALEKTIELDPSRSDARLQRGRLYLLGRQFDEAEQDANTILRADPNNAGAYGLLGGALLGQGTSDQAREAFSKRAQLSPNDANSYLDLAMVEISLRRFPEAEEQLKKAIATVRIHGEPR